MLQARLLGQFDLRWEGKRISLPTRASQSLFAYLILSAGTPHRREKVAGVFWSELPEDIARRNLRQELWRVRKALAAHAPGELTFIRADDITVEFDPAAPYWLDVNALDKPDTQLESLLANLAHYRGELLPGFYDDWILVERERVQALFENKMQLLLDQLVAAERWTAVQEWSERWLALGDTPEPAFRALMLAHAVRGDMPRVTAVYQRCVQALRDELGVDPSAETHALYEGLLKGAQVPSRATSAHPVGTVTFLFTDIEGSTRLLERLKEQYATVLVEHRDLLRAAFNKWNGREMDTQGDAFFVAFARAQDAIACAVEAQRALYAHPWTGGERVRVRMGLHTGEPLVAATGYVGMDVHRAARIGDAGHGGQVLLSQTTFDLVAHDLPEGVTVQDLGEHRLKDLKYPSQIYQLSIGGLPDSFPPLKTSFTGAEPPVPGESPFKGLEYFDIADAPIFFGRETLTARLLQRLQESPALLVVVGASGSGKSSIVRAGIVPAILQAQPKTQIEVLTPTAHPLQALALAFTREHTSLAATATLMDDLARDPRSLHLYLSKTKDEGRRTKEPHPSGLQVFPTAEGGEKPQSIVLRRVLLVVDQFEELFTLCRDEFEREAFIDNLLYACGTGSSLTLVMTLRADFYAHLANYPELRACAAQNQEYIGPMSTDELRRAMTEPARRGHWEFEPGLVDLILRDVGEEPGALPLLSHALLETWKRRAGYTLTLKGYHDAGGVRGAIAQTAETIYRELPPAQQEIARNIFLRLTELGDGTEDTRRRARFEELETTDADAAQVRAVITRLSDARLITTSEQGIEVAHEALIREWQTLRAWLDADREQLRLHRGLTEAAEEWALLEHDPGALYRGVQLAQAAAFADTHGAQLNELERAFVNASQAQQEDEAREKVEQVQRELGAAQKLAEQEQRANHQLRRRALFLGAALVLAIGLAALALFLGDTARQSTATAEANARTATARELAASAMNNLNVEPERSILLAMQAISTTYGINSSTTVEAVQALHSAIQNSRLQLAIPAPHVSAIAYAPDGRRLAAGDLEGRVRILDTTTGKELGTFQAYENAVFNVAFHPNGKKIATVSEDGTVRLWDLDTREPLLTWQPHRSNVTFVAFSRDGTRLVTAGDSNTAKIWDAQTGDLKLTLSGHTDQVAAADFSPDGTRIATAGYDNAVKVWDARTGKEIFSLTDFVYFVFFVAFSPDGKLLATGGDQYPKIWDAATGKPITTLPGLKNAINGLAFTPDGKYIAAGGQDGTASVWDAATGQEYLHLPGASPLDAGIAISPGCVTPPIAPVEWCGKFMAAGTQDGTIKLWDISPVGNHEVLTVPGILNFVNTDGVTLTTATLVDKDGVLNRVWSLPNLPTPLQDPTQPDPNLTNMPGRQLAQYTAGKWKPSPEWATPPVIALDMVRGRVASISNDYVAHIVDMTTGKELLNFPLTGHTAPIWFRGIAYSPDGTRLATASQDGTAKVWDLEHGGKELWTYSSPQELLPIAYSADGKRLAIGSEDKTVRVLDAESGKELLVLVGLNDEPANIVFSPDGTRLASSSFDLTARVWDLASGKELLTLNGHNATVWGLAYSPDGKYIATGSTDGTAKLWDADSGKLLLTLDVPNGVVQLNFTADGTRLVTSSITDQMTRVYLLPVNDLMSLAQTRVSRPLTTNECREFLHMEQCPP